MKQVKTSELKEGLLVAVDVYTPLKQLIIKAGTKITALDIAHLEFYKIPSVTIVEDNEKWEDDWRIDPTISTTIPVKNGRKIFSEAILSMVNKPHDINGEVTSEIMKSAPSTVNTRAFQEYQVNYILNSEINKVKFNKIIREEEEINAEEYLDQIKALVPDDSTPLGVLDMLNHMRNSDDATFIHSQNVALMCNSMGNWLKMSQEDINVLTLAGLFHDIGKLFVPETLLNKTGKLTDKELEVCRGHAVFGYNFMKDKDIDPRIKKVILNHHERCDGSGYPNKLTGKDIDEFSKIVAMVDVYDAMTSQRKYRNPKCPFEVLEDFEKDGIKKFDPKYLFLFLEKISGSFVNRWVILNNGQRGSIIMINKNAISRPVVKIDDTFLDLSTTPSLKISGVL
ncbi:MAG: HD-GYP domain-containing protein [Lachnospiraceae bacterium]|jgi:putative nucleotidyltransferase with HDIG domain|nr:HD-GYP domain-containing protein [Lachnospiraceae bacterium]